MSTNIFKENYLKKNGFHLFASQKSNGMKDVISDLLAELIRVDASVLLVSSDSTSKMTRVNLNDNSSDQQAARSTSNISRIDYIPEEKQFYSLAQEFDNIMVIGDEWSSTLYACLLLAERGHKVLYTTSTSSLISGFRKILSAFDDNQRYRFAEVFIQGCWQMLVDLHPVQEIFVSNPNIIENISCSNYVELEKLLNHVDLKNAYSPALGLNQSLLQAVIRRKVTISQAISSSRNPEDFDKILKSVGV